MFYAHTNPWPHSQQNIIPWPTTPTLPSIPTKSLSIPTNHRIKRGHKHIRSEKKKITRHPDKEFPSFYWKPTTFRPASPIYKRATAKHQIWMEWKFLTTPKDIPSIRPPERSPIRGGKTMKEPGRDEDGRFLEEVPPSVIRLPSSYLS